MESTTTITSKNQITVPKAVREELGVRPGDKLEFFASDGVLMVRAKRERRKPSGIGQVHSRSLAKSTTLSASPLFSKPILKPIRF